MDGWHILAAHPDYAVTALLFFVGMTFHPRGIAAVCAIIIAIFLLMHA